MGIDKTRLKSEIDEDMLICPLCDEVFKDPVMVIGNEVKCQHSFCRRCLEQHVNETGRCPNSECGLPIGDGDWTNNKTLEKKLSKLLLACPFNLNGCDQVITLPSLSIHTAECCHNPDVTQACVGGCGVQLTKEQVNSHRCVEALKEKITKLEEKLKISQQEKNEIKSDLKKHKTVFEEKQIHSDGFNLNDSKILKEKNIQLEKMIYQLVNENKNIKTIIIPVIIAIFIVLASVILKIAITTKYDGEMVNKTINEQIDMINKTINEKIEILEKWQTEKVKHDYKIWLSMFPENSNKNYLQYIEKLRKKYIIMNWKLEEVLKRYNPRFTVPLDDSISTESFNFFNLFAPIVLSTLRENLNFGSSCLFTADLGCFFTTCGALMVGPGGKIFTYLDYKKNCETQLNNKFTHHIINHIDIDYQNKRLQQNGKQLTNLTFDCIVSSNEEVDWFFGLKPGGRLIIYKPDTYDSFRLIEKEMGGIVRNGEVKLNLKLHDMI